MADIDTVHYVSIWGHVTSASSSAAPVVFGVADNISSCLVCRERVGNSATSRDAKSPMNSASLSRRTSDCTLKLEEILHNLAHVDRRLQVR